MLEQYAQSQVMFPFIKKKLSFIRHDWANAIEKEKNLDVILQDFIFWFYSRFLRFTLATVKSTIWRRPSTTKKFLEFLNIMKAKCVTHPPKQQTKIFILSFNGWFISDVDECRANNGNCEHKCFNSIGSFYCGCHEGFQLAEDNKRCVGKKDTIIIKKFRNIEQTWIKQSVYNCYIWHTDKLLYNTV